MRGELLYHSHHQILIVLIEKSPFCCLTLFVQFLDDHTNTVEIHKIVVALSMKHLRGIVFSSLYSIFF